MCNVHFLKLMLLYCVEHLHAEYWKGFSQIQSYQYFKEEIEWTGIIATTLCMEMWEVYPMQADSCARATRESRDCRVLPRSLEVQMWKQIVHAMMCMVFICLLLARCLFYQLQEGYYVINHFSSLDIEKIRKHIKAWLFYRCNTIPFESWFGTLLNSCYISNLFSIYKQVSNITNYVYRTTFYI